MNFNKGIFALLLILTMSFFSYADKKLLSKGDRAPKFMVETHDGKEVTQKNFRGVYYSFIFEGRNGANKNDHVRDRIENFIRMLPLNKRKKITFFSIADVEGYVSLIRGIIRSKIESKEKENNVRIYCDFEGHILNRFGLKSNYTNFVLVDDNGIIRFIERGVVSENKLNQISNYLMEEFNAAYANAIIDISAAYNSAGYKIRAIQR